MNIGKLIFAIQEKIAAPSTTALELLMLKKALEKLEVGGIDVLPYFSNLPDATLNTGKLYYVSADEMLYWSAGDTWRSIRITSKNYAWTWGRNDKGQLGDGTTVNKSSPVSVVANFDDWENISSYSRHSIGLKFNKSLWSWGYNIYGQFGNNSTVSRSSPVSVIGGFTDWSQISVSLGHSIALRSNGTVWTWGNNTYGRLGDNTTVNKSSPISIAGGFVDWCQVRAGGNGNLAIRLDGTMWSWGQNVGGKLGDGTATVKSSPVSVVGGFTDWCQASTSCLKSLGLRTNGTAWTWGTNGTNGYLGDGTTVNKSSPVLVVGGFADWCDLKSGYNHGLGIRTNGTIWSWGANNFGQLGDGTIVNKCSPVSIAGGFTDWCQISAGRLQSLGLRTNGTAWSWGQNYCGSLGAGTTTNRSSPGSVVGGFTDWCQVNSAACSSSAMRSISF